MRSKRVQQAVPERLENGDVLLRITNDDGTPTTARIPIGHPNHARWLAAADRRNRPATAGVVAAILLAFLCPVSGLATALYYAVKRHGYVVVAIILSAALGLWTYLAVLELLQTAS